MVGGWAGVCVCGGGRVCFLFVGWAGVWGVGRSDGVWERKEGQGCRGTTPVGGGGMRLTSKEAVIRLSPSHIINHDALPVRWRDCAQNTTREAHHHRFDLFEEMRIKCVFECCFCDVCVCVSEREDHV